MALSSSKSQKFQSFGKDLPLREESPSAIFFTKLGVGGLGKGVQGPPPSCQISLSWL